MRSGKRPRSTAPSRLDPAPSTFADPTAAPGNATRPFSTRTVRSAGATTAACARRWCNNEWLSEAECDESAPVETHDSTGPSCADLCCQAHDACCGKPKTEQHNCNGMIVDCLSKARARARGPAHPPDLRLHPVSAVQPALAHVHARRRACTRWRNRSGDGRCRELVLRLAMPERRRARGGGRVMGHTRQPRPGSRRPRPRGLPDKPASLCTVALRGERRRSIANRVVL